MKKYISGLFLLLILTACNTKNDGNEKKTDTDYFEDVAGTAQNGKYTVLNPDILKIKWETNLKKELMPLNDVELTDFEIIKGKTEGDAVEDYYMIISKTANEFTKVAALLELKDGTFYFKRREGGSVKSYQTIICRGKIQTACKPAVRINEGLMDLVCSSNVDCEKIDCEIY
ncbi:lipoprotein [Flavobacterium cerinum]|uniref:Type IV secretion system putative lipoprotein virB7 n=1 Tax=Flavobacterium cerinum TaxID=2502784 RepID=A0A444HFC6_9FLAO|nr:lipoprotein [Flavobacterium cerinum]RWX03688.1 hypothetical protein EPI11_01810 [Flavobacterium cerinum]